MFVFVIKPARIIVHITNQYYLTDFKCAAILDREALRRKTITAVVVSNRGIPRFLHDYFLLFGRKTFLTYVRDLF